jgi:hypothetical protein
VRLDAGGTLPALGVYENNELRLAALAKIDPEARRKYRLGRLLEVEGDGPDAGAYTLNFSVGLGPDMPRLAPRAPAVVDADKDLQDVLNGEGLRLLALPGLRELPVTGLKVTGAFGAHGQVDPANVRAFFKRSELQGIRRLDVRTVKIGAASTAIAGSKFLGALATLNLSGTGAKLAPLLDAKNLGALRRLDFGQNNATTPDLLAAIKSPGLAGLTSVDFSSAAVADEGFEALAAAPELERFEALGLQQTSLTARSWRALAESARLPRLRALTVGAAKSFEGSSAVLLTGEHFPELAELTIAVLEPRLPPIRLGALRRLDVQILSADALRDLAASPALGRLEHLSLRIPWTALDGDALTALYESAGFRGLASLSLHPYQWARDRAEALRICRLPAFTRLRRFALDGPMDGELVGALLAAGGLRGLESLKLERLDADGARVLTESSDLAGLKELRVVAPELGNEGFVALARSSSMKSLEVLDLDRQLLGDPALTALLETDNFRRLVKLRVGERRDLPPALAPVRKHLNMPKLWVFTGLGDPADAEVRFHLPASEPP